MSKLMHKNITEIQISIKSLPIKKMQKEMTQIPNYKIMREYARN